MGCKKNNRSNLKMISSAKYIIKIYPLPALNSTVLTEQNYAIYLLVVRIMLIGIKSKLLIFLLYSEIVC